ncbi:hypothetical protein SRABI27_02036 [Pedobacter sp. Bi27]|jgi:hypothetical protein|uniref:RagB/SusD family nutrient uptake outer membrane protein n=1 Tax=unclassified Pedobacter TaxID=2628915 RepID=UPI001D4FB53D|nr:MULTISPECIES: RagB/SusD family nutrient uptake outer membrane protein [unclassified Pedobacter]CAH0189453.1 hypothetical protein SRABI36_01713 [Pedobacter sp. Bi36]CAH0213029.1 hypothetical protein SRABI27_02036 [Pedobacter sp. Bi27]CAH0245288.1 hypothetical protein SRABI126_02807 [Pedobacter sp. Bi126]
MKKYLKSYRLQLVKAAIVAIPLITGITSCKKETLQIAPELSLSDVNAYETPARIEALVTGLYSTAKSGSLFGGRYQIYNDIRAEEFINRTSNGVTGSTVYNSTNNNGDTYVANFWNQGYLLINRVNVFLDGLEANKSKVTQAQYDQFASEAKFLRGLTYFSLVQIFAKPYISNAGASRGLPLRLLPEIGTANNILKSSSVAEIYTQILKDLDAAETGLPNTYSTALLRTTRAHKNTAIALKTRVYLTMGNYAKVVEEGDKIVPAAAPFSTSARAPHALAASVRAVFTAPYTTSESIFSFPFADTNAPGTQNQIGYYFSWDGGGNLDYALNTTTGTYSGIYTDPIWPATDARKTSALISTATISGTLYTYPTKHSAVSPFVDYVTMIRYAEVLLNVAEAEALRAGGNLVRSRALLDAVRKRSDATYDFGVLATGAQLADVILKERRIELLMEGFRYNDIARKNLPLKSYGANATIPVADVRYSLPIPAQEIISNPAAEW